MSESEYRCELEALKAELDKARLDNRKLNRQIMALNNVVERAKAAAIAKAGLTAVISAEKSKQEKYMNLLLENSPDIIIFLDQNGRFVYCTDTFLRLARIQSFGLVNGRTFQEVFTPIMGPDWIGRMEAGLAKASRKGVSVLLDETAELSGEGDPRSYTIHITPMLDDRGTLEGALVFFNDLTDVLRAKKMAEQASNAKSDFLATVSHEIRTPMNAIIGISDMIKRTPLSQQQLAYMMQIENSSHVLLNLINDILDFSKIEAGKLDLLNEFFSLSDLLSQIKTMFDLLFKEKDIRFACRFDPALPQVARGDEKRVRQVLTNILNNALKYTERGMVRFDASLGEDGAIHFAIADSGMGIREEDIGRLFAPFEQLDKVKNKRVVGTGLGLTITHRLCTLMGGGISVQSQYGEGSTFTVRIPLEAGRPEDLPREDTTNLTFSAPDAKVLLVDDIEINLMVAAAMLEPYAIVADQAQSGAEAVRLASRHRYDLIYMDHMMPGMDGIETTQAIRGLGGYNAKVPIVALTANAVSGAKEMFIQSGLNGFLSKPIDRGALAKSLLKWLPAAKIRQRSGQSE